MASVSIKYRLLQSKLKIKSHALQSISFSFNLSLQDQSRTGRPDIGSAFTTADETALFAEETPSLNFPKKQYRQLFVLSKCGFQAPALTLCSNTALLPIKKRKKEKKTLQLCNLLHPGT